MSDPVVPSPLPASPAARKKSSRLRNLLLATVVGAMIGALLGRRDPNRPPFHAAFLLTPMAICLELWLVLSIYWEWAARNASAAKSAESSASRLLHLALINGAIVLAFWPFAGWPGPTWRSFEFPRVLPETTWLPWVGVAIAFASLVLAIWARRHLGRNWSGAVTVKVDHELVRTGPYRRIRHPIYTGAIGMYLGAALASGRLQGVLALALVAIAYVRKVRMEEANMRREFGAAYDEYARTSWAVIPWVL